MTQAESFFDPWQEVVTDWSSALTQINKILEITTAQRTVAWRGVVDASWALHSSLYRRFFNATGATPDEKELVTFERQLLARSRADWRFDNLAALETLAHLQHYGGPTRLLDVTFNPLVALWVAVEQKFDPDGLPISDVDGRIFAFDVTHRQIELDGKWGTRDLPWATSPENTWRRGLPRIWRPPSYNDRIPAQNSAFLIGGVPLVYGGENAKYRKGPGDGSTMGNWGVDEVRASTSVTMSMNSFMRKPQARATPTYTLRIEASCKEELRHLLEKSFGYNASTLYPDLFGLASHGANGISLSQ